MANYIPLIVAVYLLIGSFITGLFVDKLVEAAEEDKSFNLAGTGCLITLMWPAAIAINLGIAVKNLLTKENN